jgi:hypothetical protein
LEDDSSQEMFNDSLVETVGESLDFRKKSFTANNLHSNKSFNENNQRTCYNKFDCSI